MEDSGQPLGGSSSGGAENGLEPLVETTDAVLDSGGSIWGSLLSTVTNIGLMVTAVALLMGCVSRHNFDCVANQTLTQGASHCVPP
jgi:hypothetical protein